MTERESWEQGLQEGDLKQTVLIAEDEKLLAQAIAVTLDLEGLHTVVAHDGEQALAMARALQPDLVLLDVKMPGRSGIEVCATLKTDPLTASIPVIMITAKAEKDDRAMGLAAGADEYVTKPFSPVHLLDLVKETMGGGSVEPQRRGPSLSAMPTDQLIVYARDLKELFQRERRERCELEGANRRLSELDELKAAFVGAITNELLTPFASIGLALEALQRQSEDRHPDLRDALDDLATQVAALHHLVKGVVRFAELASKRRVPQPGNIALSRVIPWAVQPVALLAQARGVDFRVFAAADLPRVRADPELVGEAVFQMAHNAVKFNLPEGWAQVKVLESDDYVVVEVSDAGIGLTPEQLETLDQPFEQSAGALQRGQRGLGVGWAFVRYVAESHGGWTRVQSAGPDLGSVFSLGLPATVGRQEPGTPGEAEAEEE